MHIIIDTLNDFVHCWTLASPKAQKEKFQAWMTYISSYPELLEKQIDNYKEMGLNWMEFAERVLFKVEDYIPLMKKARDNAFEICNNVYEQATRRIKLNLDVIFVLYVGIGCGAGWATLYKGHPACLIGLEKIAELGWWTKDKLEGLIAHELGHLAHMMWRNGFRSFEEEEKDPAFLLYSEGFAKRCEHLILGRETWNEADDENWVSWCRKHIKFLAKEYLSRIEKAAPVNDFFGDWLNIRGRRQTGYFLGRELILWLERSDSLESIAVLSPDEVREKTIRFLRFIAKN
ncbi:MAG: hypothetical protein ACUX7D_05015 [Candidatus Methanodesulfokora washburnensis]|jgi:hypothetical protein